MFAIHVNIISLIMNPVGQVVDHIQGRQEWGAASREGLVQTTLKLQLQHVAKWKVEFHYIKHV